MRVLVTGATSLLGQTVARQLIERGTDVAVLQRGPSGLDAKEHLGDITDPAVVARAVTGADAVVHVAARVAVVGPWKDFQRINVNGTRIVLEAARAAGASRFVQVSSPSVAHSGMSLVGASAAPADPGGARGHYARSKALAEQAVLAAPDMAVLAVRPHLVWGPGDTQLIGRIVERARRGRLAVVGSGMALIDTTYIDNAADAIIAALDKAPDLSGRALVISNGEPRPVRELFDRIATAAAVESSRLKVPAAVAWLGGALAERVWNCTGRTGDPPMTSFMAEQLSTAHWFDQRETRQLLGWTPAVPLDEGFRRLTAWYQADC
ncbi:NAD-dependent epimerase/dehydratase family protein [Pseudohaliea rubra]|uniref:NAD(P)H steroid dehydrogenase-like protein in alkane synthesis cluster n=1 Tax=Pseudohaliea rubra DSM 19751 TaxID=1265313 RepID=A0A095VVF8_9GAMM|nr:NAD-dependent epimerase/dehydratase family protein [Pseudohaliea rubra]KGE05018.1 NAD(P)H steroid dehydrogenase-like protein in alkane synthesis cluster [Pseudohaliea rubra DSM 19751]